MRCHWFTQSEMDQDRDEWQMNYAALATTIELNVLMHLLTWARMVRRCTVYYGTGECVCEERVVKYEASFPIDRKTSLPDEM